MKQLAWVLLGVLMATAMGEVDQGKPTSSTVIHLITTPFNPVQRRSAQEERLAAAIEELASESSDPPAEPVGVKAEPAATHKTAQGILQAVEAVVASLTPDTPAAEPVKSEEVADAIKSGILSAEGEPQPGVETPAGVAEGESEATPEATVTEQETPVQPEEETVDTGEPETETEHRQNKKEQKLIAKNNEIVDKVLVVLEKRLKAIGPFPINLNEESLLALDQEVEPETEAPVETAKGSGERRGANGKKKKNRKNKKNNKKNRKNKNRKSSEDQEVENIKRKNNNSNEKNNNNNRSNEKSGNKNNNSGKKNKKNKNMRNKNKNNSNKKRRNPKALSVDGDEDEDDAQVEMVKQSRRKDSPPSVKRINKRRANKNKRKNNKKNKKSRNNKINGRSDIESRQETGPIYPTNEEKAAANGRLAGISKLTRNGDVEITTKNKKSQIKAMVTVGPLSANLKDNTRAISKAQVMTSLNAEITFKLKSVSRRTKINVSGVEITEVTPQDVTITRADLELDAADVTPVQEQVSEAIDVSRVSSIISKELEDIFDKDNTVENLEEHPFLQN